MVWRSLEPAKTVRLAPIFQRFRCGAVTRHHFVQHVDGCLHTACQFHDCSNRNVNQAHMANSVAKPARKIRMRSGTLLLPI